MISDLGSTNGHFVDGVRLVPQQPLVLANGEILLEIGKTDAEPAPAWLRFRVSASNAVELSFGEQSEEEAGAGLKWLFVHKVASVGCAPQASLVVANSGADFAAELSFHNQGLWITPRQSRSVQIDGHEFSQATPLPIGCELRVGAAAWRIEKSRPIAAKPQSVPATAIA